MAGGHCPTSIHLVSSASRICRVNQHDTVTSYGHKSAKRHITILEVRESCRTEILQIEVCSCRTVINYKQC